MLARITSILCVLSAFAEFVLSGTSTKQLIPQDYLSLLLVISPYMALAIISRRHQNHTGRSWFLLALAVTLSAWGIYVFATDSYRYHTEPDYRKLQRMAVFIVPVIQWVAVLLAGIVLLILHIRSKKGRPTSDS